MRQRLTAWMALFAMLASMALPAHAYANHAPAGTPGADYCTTVKPAAAAADGTAKAPTSPSRDHAVQCDGCCGCSSVAVAPALPGSWPTPAAARAEPVDQPAVASSAGAGFALARGPPAQA